MRPESSGSQREKKRGSSGRKKEKRPEEKNVGLSVKKTEKKLCFNVKQ